MSSSPTVKQRPTNLSDVLASASRALSQTANAQASKSVVNQFASFAEAIGETDALSYYNATTRGSKLSETVGETDSTAGNKTCTGFRLDSAGGGRCIFSLDANYTDGGGQLDF